MPTKSLQNCVIFSGVHSPRAAYSLPDQSGQVRKFEMEDGQFWPDPAKTPPIHQLLCLMCNVCQRLGEVRVLGNHTIR